MKNLFSKSLALAVLAGAPYALHAQQSQTGQPSAGQAFSLNQAVSYALEHSVQVRNAQTDLAIARGRVGEVRAAGLPQVNGNIAYTRNFAIQRFVLEYDKGNQFTAQSVALNPDLQGKPTGFGFALPHALSAGVTFSQLLFSGTYLLGLKAANVYTGLAQKQLDQSRINLKASVTKAYYQAMVGEQQIALLDNSIARLDTTLQQTTAQYKAGLVERIDIDRLEVQRNNLISEKENAQRQVALAGTALKFSMGYPVREPIIITDKIEQATIDAAAKQDVGGAYDQRIDYQILSTQESLQTLDMRAKRSGYLPSLSFTGNIGQNTAASNGNFGQMFSKVFAPADHYNIIVQKADPSTGQPEVRQTVTSQRWYPYFFIGLNLNVPIFDGFTKKYQIQQSALTLKKVRDSKELVRNQIDFEVERANISTTNAMSRLQTQTRNINLAKEVVRVSRIKYQQGVGSNLEVVNAEADLRAAQTNYYTALYDALVAKVDADVAAGRVLAN